MTTPADIRRAYRIAAQWAVRDPAYTPIFERLEAEVARLQAETNSAQDRARRALAAAT